MSDSSIELTDLLADDRNANVTNQIRVLSPMIWVKDREGAYRFTNEQARIFLGGLDESVVSAKRDTDFFSAEVCRALERMENAAMAECSHQSELIERVSLIQAVAPFLPTQRDTYSFHSTVMPFYEHGEEEPSGTIHVAMNCTPALGLLREVVDDQYNAMLNSAFSSSSESTLDANSREPDFRYTHDLEGNLTHVSEKLAQLLPYSRGDKINIREIIFEKDKPRLERSLKNGFADVSPDKRVIWRVKTRSGKQPLWLSVRVERKQRGDETEIVGKGWVVGTSTLNALQRNSRIIRGGRVAGWDREIGSNHFFVSDEWKVMLGLPVSKKVSFEEFRALIHEDDRVRVSKTMSSHLAGQLGYYEAIYRIRHSNDSYRWIQAVGQSSTGFDGRRFVSGCNIDITHEMQTAADLLDKDSLLRTIVDADPALVFLKNSLRRFVFVNKALCDFYDSTFETVYGKTDNHFFKHLMGNEGIAEQLQHFRDADESVLAADEGESFDFVECIIPPNGSSEDARWYKTVKVRTSLNGKPHILGISSDITKLVYENEMYEQLMELSPAPMYVKKESGEYTSVNQSFAKLVGAKGREEVLGRNSEEFFHDENHELAESDASVFFGGCEMMADRKLRRKNDGKELFVVESKRVARVIGEDGKTEKRLLGCDLNETDARTRANIEAMKTFEHAVKDVGSKLLLSAQELVRSITSDRTEERVMTAARNVFRSAIYISGPQNFFKGWQTDKAALTTGSFSSVYDSALRSRLRYHRDYARLFSKAFEFPETVTGDISGAEIVQNHELLANVLDIMSINAVQHGGQRIRVSLDCDRGFIRIMVQDNGSGFPDDDIREVTAFDSGELDLSRGHVGLKVAKQALIASGMMLKVKNRRHSDGYRASAEIHIPVLSNEE